MQGRLNLRERLVLLMVAAVLPMFALSLWVAVRETRAATEMAQSQLKFAASLLAANQDRAADAAEQLLGAIAAMPDLRLDGRGRCQAYFESLRDRYRMYSNIGLLAVDGQVVCHARGAIGDATAADRGYFRQALSQRRFVMGEPIYGRISGLRAIPFAMPVIESGRVTGVVFASLDLAHAAEALARVALPEGARVLVADRHKHVLMEYPAQGSRPVVREVVHPELLEAARTMSSGVGEGVDSTGEDRVFAFAPSRMIGTEGFVVRVGISRSLVTAGASAHRTEALLVLALTMLAAMGATWWIGGHVIVKPAKQILGTVRRLEQGNLDARVQLQAGSQRGEFAHIGAAFNLMAESLQLRRLDLENELGRSRSAYAVLDLVINSMQEALVAVTSSGQFLMFNEAAGRLFPLNGPPAVPQQWPALFGFYRADGTTLYRVEDLPLVRSARGESGRQELLFVRNAQVPEGRLLQCSWQPIRGEGRVNGGLVVFTDVTELQRLQAEQAAQLEQLHETQRKLVEAQRIGRVGNWELDLATGRLWWSDEVFGLFGIAREHFEPTLNGFERWVHPDDRPLLKPARDGALRDGKVMNVEYRVIKPDGSIAWMHELAEARRDERGEPVWFGGVVQDITERKHAEQENAALFTQIRELNAGLEARIAERTAELARQEQLYRTLAEQAPEVVWNTDASGRSLTFLNCAWYELVGGAPEDWLGHSGLAAIHPDDRAEVSDNWRKSQQSLSAFTGVRRMLSRDGTYHTMSYKGAPVLNEQGQVAFWVGIDADITEFKAIERALRGSNQELEAFSYSVSHDLRAPLGAITGFSRALAGKLEGQLDERAQHYLARIQAGVEKMEHLIEALLSLAKVARAPLQYGPVDLSAIARETLEELQMQHPGRKVAVQVRDGLATQGDARLLRVLLENLLGNAWKFTSQREQAQIEVGRVDGGSEFFVRDNGVGFDMAYAGKLFSAFHRLHTEAEFPGTGIGLATVRRIVARHQGRAWAQSHVGEGTTIFFSLSQAPPPAWLEAQALGPDSP
ncbi:MAG: putative histidine kinase, classic [Ramlibacter sp.]|nr:putative histidine kinase, classic [Ramlibacter sp.]